MGVLAVARGAGQLPGGALGAGLDRVEGEAGLLDVLARARREHQVRVERRVPAGEEPALDLGVLREAGLADALASQGVLLQRRRERVLARPRVLLVQELRARQARARERVVERLGLRLGRRRRDQGRLGLGGRRGVRQEVHLLADGAAEVLEGLLDVGRVIVGLVGVLRAVIFRWWYQREPRSIRCRLLL